MFDAGIMVEVVIWVPVPPEPVNQPAKTEPVFVGVGSVLIFEPAVFFSDVGDTVPPLGFHVIVILAAVHFA